MGGLSHPTSFCLSIFVFDMTACSLPQLFGKQPELRTPLAQAGRRASHTEVRSALADITFVAFRLLAPLSATANLSWRGSHWYFRAEHLRCHMTHGWRTVIHWT